jgi:isoleucyl-tRNA synthetase
LALAVNHTLEYCRFTDDTAGKSYICMKERLAYVVKQAKIAKHTVHETMLGQALIGKQYEPLFSFFEERVADKCFSVIASDHVTSETGTGIVHCAPGFGEEDY